MVWAKVEFQTVKIITTQRDVFREIITGMSKKYVCQYTFACNTEGMAFGGSFEDK